VLRQFGFNDQCHIRGGLPHAQGQLLFQFRVNGDGPQSATDVALVIEPKLAQHVMAALSKLVQQMLAAGHPPVVLCAPQLRLAFRRFFENTFSDLAVLSYSEIPARMQVQSAAVIHSLE
jgi:flagellar biosynthesis component FlhA